MNNAILATEVFGIIVLLIILYGSIFESNIKTKKIFSFQILTTSVIITLIVDALSYLPFDWIKYHTFQYIITVLAFVLTFVVYTFFLNYMNMYIITKTKSATIMLYIGIAYCIVGCILTLIFSLTGRLFYFDNGAYNIGDYYNIYLISYVVIFLYTTLVIILNSKKMGFHDLIATMLFMIVPIIFILLNIVFPAFSFSVSALSISIVILNTMIQSEEEKKLIASEVKSSKLAHIDELTGLLNRLAYNELLESFKSDEVIGVIFADVNGLKYCNDHYGHKSGDKLLKDFAKILLGCFRKDDVFRISGDEFVVLLPGMPLLTFDRKIRKLRDELNSMNVPIASFGSVHGSQSEIARLIDMAEEKMYIDKNEFKSKYPIYKR